MSNKIFTWSGKSMVFFSLLVGCACTPKKTTRNNPTIINTTLTSNSPHRSFLEDAKQFDSLVPLGFRCIKRYISSGQDNPLLLVRYEGTQPPVKVVSFYKRELEAAGWDLSNFSSDQEGLFFCHKGQQDCAIRVYAKGKTIITFSYRIKAPIHQPNDIATINKSFSF